MLIPRSWRHASLALMLGLAAGGAIASGDVPYDIFVPRYASDVDPDRYDAGELGVVLPSYGRAFLYPAWRAIVLGREGLQRAPAKGLGDIFAGDRSAGWTDANAGAASDSETPLAAWLKASAPYAAPAREKLTEGMRKAADEYSQYLVCNESAFSFAVETLDRLAKRNDASPQRLRTWVEGQDKVFAICGVKEERAAIDAYPLGLPASETSFFWRQMRDYQTAAAAFYNGDFDDSARRFEAIGANPRSPMFVWGAYLALRSRARAADLDTTPATQRKEVDRKVAAQSALQKSNPTAYEAMRQAAYAALERETAARRARQLADLEARTRAILADPRLAEIHPAARGTLHTMQARLAPQARFDTLTAELDDPGADPYAESRFNDWRILADTFYDNNGVDKAVEAQARARHPFFDWIRGLQVCGQSVTVAGESEPPKENKGVREARERCRAEYAHALAQWQAAAPVSNGPDPRRAWLTAALMLADTLPPELEQAALAVPAQAPEYLTVRYNLARLYRLRGHAGQARAIGDEQLRNLRGEKPLSMAARNLFMQERFATAATVDEALGLLLRTPTFGIGSAALRYDADSPGARLPRPAGDGLRWLNGHLGNAELLAAADDQRLDAVTRAQLGVSAWLRADMLGQGELAAHAAGWVAVHVPMLKASAARYLGLPTLAQRRHALVLVMLDYQLHPYVDSHRTDITAKWEKQKDPSVVTASMWCKIDDDPYAYASESGVEQLPPALRISANPAARDHDIGLIKRSKTATGYVGHHVMAWAAAHPKDAQVPWLLSVVVSSTRGGCLDPGSSKLSRAAFVLLHAKYKNSEWTENTPYWY